MNSRNNISMSGSFSSFFSCITNMGNLNDTFGSTWVIFSLPIDVENNLRFVLLFPPKTSASCWSGSDDCDDANDLLVVETLAGGRIKSAGTLNKFSVVSNNCSYSLRDNDNVSGLTTLPVTYYYSILPN